MVVADHGEPAPLRSIRRAWRGAGQQRQAIASGQEAGIAVRQSRSPTAPTVVDASGGQLDIGGHRRDAVRLSDG